tara:strand:- start:2749 stop:3507 length:759 start_codon:yes stop_codon:yes gene_type:complete
MFEVIFLSIVQGITEFLPISSSAHLVLFSEYFNFSDASLTLDISLHLGSLLATVFYFKKDLFDLTNNKVFFFKIILSSVPVIFFGYLLVKFNLIDNLRNYKVIGWTTILFGILLYLSDLSKTNKTIKKDFKYSSAVYIGVFQILSLIPGVSRSGITITGARFQNFNRVDAAKISFLISIPALAAVSFFNIFSLYQTGDLNISILNLMGVSLSFIFSYLTIKYFLGFIKRFNLNIFVIYRIFLGSVILFFSYL